MGRKLPDGLQETSSRRPTQQRSFARVQHCYLCGQWCSCCLLHWINLLAWLRFLAANCQQQFRVSLEHPKGDYMSILTHERYWRGAHLPQWGSRESADVLQGTKRATILANAPYTRSSKEQYSKGLISLLVRKLADVELYHSKAVGTIVKVDGLLTYSETMPIVHVMTTSQTVVMIVMILKRIMTFCKPSSIMWISLSISFTIKTVKTSLSFGTCTYMKKKKGRLVDILQGTPAKFKGNCSYIYLVLMHNRRT